MPAPSCPCHERCLQLEAEIRALSSEIEKLKVAENIEVLRNAKAEVNLLYVSPHGECFHRDPHCEGLRKAKAKASKRPCKHCLPNGLARVEAASEIEAALVGEAEIESLQANDTQRVLFESFQSESQSSKNK